MDEFKPRLANSSPLTPLWFIERAATAYADSVSIIYNNTTYTWSQTHHRCLRLASSISSLGIKPGQVISVIAPNIPAIYELHFAVPMCGAVLNTINTRLDASTISVLLCHSESKLIFVDYLSRSLFMEAMSLLPAQTQVPLFILIDETDTSDPMSYEGMIQKGYAEYKWIQPKCEWTPIVLNYTSGTTSSPKGVVHSHRGAFIVAMSSLIEWSVPQQPVFLWTLPMFHANGWAFTWAMAAVGGTNICLRNFNSSTIFKEICRHNVTHMCGAPVVLRMLANAPDPEPLAHPVRIMTAGAPPPPAVLLRSESLGFVITHGYGLTETGGTAVTCAWKREWDQFSANERAMLKTRQGVRNNAMACLDVVDNKTGLSVKRDGLSLGEVVLRGPIVTLGYLKDPVGTDKCMREDGWFYTGDMGVIHPDGYMEIKDRLKDVIISGGENINSVEVESVLYSHPDIEEAAVVARMDEFWGETPCAFVSLKTESKEVTEKDILEYCRARMPHYMVPKTVIFLAELPKTSTGKVQKFVLRQKAKALGISRYSRM